MIKWEEAKIEHYDNSTENKKCVIVIPVYKKEPSIFEKASLKQVVTILGGKYELVLVCPKSLDVSIYNNIANYKFSLLRCSNSYFTSQRSYSDLCETWEFYDAFSMYEYMVIYQLDAWIFENRLEYFINMGYDYIGAPHLLGFGGKTEGENGNGGFCLRKIKPFLNVCKKTDFSKFKALEDCVFTQSLKSNFKLAPLDVCRQFSFQESPQVQFRKNGNKLPMGCHAFRKFNESFWKQYIQTDAWRETNVSDRDLNKVSLSLIAGDIDGIKQSDWKIRKFFPNKRKVVRKFQ